MENKNTPNKKSIKITLPDNIEIDIKWQDEEKKIGEIIQILRDFINSDIIIENI